MFNIGYINPFECSNFFYIYFFDKKTHGSSALFMPRLWKAFFLPGDRQKAYQASVFVDAFIENFVGTYDNYRL